MTRTMNADPVKRTYWMATGLFLLLFGSSVIYGLVDLRASYAEFQHLEFPVWSFYFLTIAKVLGIAAIVSNRSRTLKDFAFAGFLFDLLLALGAHIAHMELKLLLPLGGLAIWAFAFVQDRKFCR